MQIIRLGEKQVVLGLRWETASELSSINKESIFDTWNSSHGVKINSSRSAYGLLKDARDGGIPKEKLYSLAAFMAQYNHNSIMVFEFPDINERTLYWCCLVNKGAVEMDAVLDDLNSAIAPAIRRLNDPIDATLVKGDVESPILITNIANRPEINEMVSLRNFNVEDVSLESLDVDISAEKLSSSLQIKDLNFNLNYFFKTITTEKRKELGIVSSIILLILLASVFLTDEKAGEIDALFTDQLANYKASVSSSGSKTAVSLIDKKDVQLAAEFFLKEKLRGAKLDWVWWAKNKFMSLPNYTYGYKKSDLSCDIYVGYCEVKYSVNNSYLEFNKALDLLRPFFDDIAFASDARSIVGRINIPSEYFFLLPVKFDMLPPFDKGENLLGPVSDLTEKRPGLSVSITTAGLESIEFKDKDYNKVEGVEKKFWFINWNSSGEYLHQLDIVIESMKRNFLTVDKFNLKRSSSTSFKMSGGYYMRTNKEEKR